MLLCFAILKKPQPKHRTVKLPSLCNECKPSLNSRRRSNMSRRLLDKLPKLMKNPEFSAAWHEAEEEFSLAREIIRARTVAGLSQQELAEKLGTTQSAVARLESSSHMPSVSTLKRVAEATHSRLRIELVSTAPVDA
jgi:ribosome-binding protein aMBF1 (putative translation factor)